MKETPPDSIPSSIAPGEQEIATRSRSIAEKYHATIEMIHYADEMHRLDESTIILSSDTKKGYGVIHKNTPVILAGRDIADPDAMWIYEIGIVPQLPYIFTRMDRYDDWHIYTYGGHPSPITTAWSGSDGKKWMGNIYSFEDEDIEKNKDNPLLLQLRIRPESIRDIRHIPTLN